MKPRRQFLRNGLASLSLVAFDSFQGTRRTRHSKHRREGHIRTGSPPVNFAGWQVTVVALTFPPGADSPKHVHPGFVLGYVLDGNFRFHLDGERERVLSTGSLFYEAPGAIHLSSGSASATEPARVLALAFGEKGKATTRLYDWQTRIANRRSPEAWTGYPYSQGNEE